MYAVNKSIQETVISGSH